MLYVGLGIIYLFLLFFLGFRTYQNRHWVLLILGFVIPFLWIAGAMLPQRACPTWTSSTRGATRATEHAEDAIRCSLLGRRTPELRAGRALALAHWSGLKIPASRG